MNILKISTAICAVIFMASCNEKITSESYGEAGYITVTSQIGSQTKAGYETKLLPAEFVMDIVQGTDKTYNYSVVMQNNGTGNRYTESTGKYLAWANTDHSKVSVKAMTIPSGVSLDENKILNISIQRFQTDNATFIKNDILGATSTKGITITDNNINVTFQHLMSKLHVVYESTDDSVVEAIALGNVALEGAYSYADMEFIQNDNPTLGSVQMFQNAGTQYGVFAAEGIFCPFTPSASSKPFIQAKISGVDSPVSCEITLPSNFSSFESGKCYVMKVNVTRSGISQVSLATENDWVKNVPGGKILWIGTSIPAGGGTVFSYPQMVANATGLEVVNNAVGGSLVLKVKDGAADLQVYTVKGSEDQIGWTEVPVGNGTFRKDEYGNYVADTEKGNFNPYLISAWDKVGAVNHLKYGGLWQTRDQVETTYRTALQSISNNDNEWVEKWINEMKNLSYESLIIPYVDGTIDNCNTIIIDHGFNDLARMVAEAGGFNTYVSDPIATDWGTNYLNKLISGDITYEQHCTHIQAMDEDPVFGTFKEYSYIIAMHDIISAIKNANPNARIIIGNYFAYDSPYVNTNTFGNAWDAYQFTKLILYYNKAVASIWDLDIVNVYEDPTVSTMVTTDFMGFCPDGVHPSSDYTGKSNKAIADVYLQELAKIFVSTKTQSSTYAYDYGWEDVEML